VFIGDFMIDLSLDLVRGVHEPCQLFPRTRGIRFHSTHHLRHGFLPADRRTSSSMTRVSCIPLDYKNKSPRRVSLPKTLSKLTRGLRRNQNIIAV
jgi:hypothetical protein